MSYVIKRPLVTEKTNVLAEHNTLVFEVDRKASKTAIKDHIERFFGVKVKNVRTLVGRSDAKRISGRKMGKKKYWKKAFVRLKDGEQIGIFEGGSK